MIEKIKTLWWFMQRPSHWAHAMALVVRKCLPDHDRPALRQAAHDWAAEHAVPVEEALRKVGLLAEGQRPPTMPPEWIDEGQAQVKEAAVTMGGPGDVDLLYGAVSLSKASSVVETGVAYGWSSLAILSAMQGQGSGRLVSVDMPYPKMGNESYVGMVVPDALRASWVLLRMPDRPGIKKAIAAFGSLIDFCHYDSDKSWWGRQYAYPLLWKALTPGGVFISDDIQDNMAFAEFVKKHHLTFAVTEYQGKYVGLCRKPV